MVQKLLQKYCSPGMLKRNTVVPKEQASKEKTVRRREDDRSHLFTEYMVTTVLLSGFEVLLL